MSGHTIAVPALEEPLLMHVDSGPRLLSGHFRHQDPPGSAPSRHVPMHFRILAGLKSSTSLLVLLIDLLAADLLFGGIFWVFAQVLIPLLQPAIDTTEFLKRYRSPQITISRDITLLNMVVLRTILTRIKQYLSSDLSLSEFYARGEEL